MHLIFLQEKVFQSFSFKITVLLFLCTYLLVFRVNNWIISHNYFSDILRDWGRLAGMKSIPCMYLGSLHCSVSLIRTSPPPRSCSKSSFLSVRRADTNSLNYLDSCEASNKVFRHVPPTSFYLSKRVSDTFQISINLFRVPGAYHA